MTGHAANNLQSLNKGTWKKTNKYKLSNMRWECQPGSSTTSFILNEASPFLANQSGHLTFPQL